MMESQSSQGKIFDSNILKKLFVFVKPYRIVFAFLIVLSLLGAILGTVRPLIVKNAIDVNILNNDNYGLLVTGLLLISVIVLQGICEFLNSFFSGYLGQHIIRDVRIKLYSHLIKFDIPFFDNNPIGRLVTRNISDIETISDVFSEGIADIASSVLLLLFIVVAMTYENWRLALISMSVVPILLFCTYIFKEKIKTTFNEVRTILSTLNSFVQEHISGMNIVQIFNNEGSEYLKFNDINKSHLKANLKSVLYYSIYFPIAEVLSAASIGLLVWWGCHQVLSNSVSFGTLIAFIMYIQMFFRPIREIADKFNTLQMGIVGSSRVFALFEHKNTNENNGIIKKMAIKGSVKFENVWFAYQKENYVLRNISFEIGEGKMLAIVGATGAGKSSIANLLNQFYTIDRGNILIDGINIKKLDLTFLRENIGMVLQDVFLFSGSISDNIRLGKQDISDQIIYNAAKQIGALEFIEKLPGGFNYNVRERGATLSVGQRQLISFIRALVFDPKIIVFDEATSSIDSETELIIQKALLTLLKGRTSIVIAHRLSTIKHADKILVLDKGEIKESGLHAELLEMNGFYTNLYEMQFEHILI